MTEALTEYIQRRKQAQILDLFGTIDFVNDSGDANGLLDPGETWFMGRTYLTTADDIGAHGAETRDTHLQGCDHGEQT